MVLKSLKFVGLASGSSKCHLVLMIQANMCLYRFSFGIISFSRVHETILGGGSNSNFFSHFVSLHLSALLKQITAPPGDGKVGNKC